MQTELASQQQAAYEALFIALPGGPDLHFINITVSVCINIVKFAYIIIYLF